MDFTFPSNHIQEDAPLSKRRCFVPSSDHLCIPSGDNNIEHHTFDSPLLLQLSGRTPTPQEIEAELLRVGMRIRKPENDRHKISAFTPRPFFNMHRLSPATQAALCSGPLNRQPISTATFCGVNLAALAHISSTPVEEQKMWSYSTSHKRGYEGDSDSDDQEFMPHTPTLGVDEDMMAIPIDYFNIDIDSQDNVSPMTQHSEPVPTYMSGRRIAKPKARKQRSIVSQQQAASHPFAQLQIPQGADATQWMGHRRMTSCGVEAQKSSNDFSDVSFLQRRGDVDMDCS